WMEIDPLLTYRDQLIDGKIATDDKFEAILEKTKQTITKICKLAIDEDISPRINLVDKPHEIEDLMFSNDRIEKMDDRECEVLIPKEDIPRVKQLDRKVRSAFDADGMPVSKNRVYQLRDALFESIIDKFY